MSSVREIVKSFKLKNTKANGDSDSLTIDRAATIIKKSVPGGRELTREDYRPDAGELALINEDSLITYEAKDCFIFVAKAIDTLTDRDYEHFLPPPARAFETAKTIFLKRAWLRDHEWDTDHTVGKILDSWVENDELGRPQLMIKFFTIDTPEQKEFLDKVFANIHKGISVGFVSDILDMLCDSCNKEKFKSGRTDYHNFTSIFDRQTCRHKPGARDEEGDRVTVSIADIMDGMEASSVPVPSERQAGVRRGKSMDNPENETPEVVEPVGETVVPSPEELAEINAAIEANKAENASGQYIPEFIKDAVDAEKASKSVADKTLGLLKELKDALAKLHGSKEEEKVKEELAAYKAAVKSYFPDEPSIDDNKIPDPADTIISESLNKVTNTVADPQAQPNGQVGNEKACDPEKEGMPKKEEMSAGMDMSQFDVRCLKEATNSLSEVLKELSGLIESQKSAFAEQTNILSENNKALTEHLVNLKSSSFQPVVEAVAPTAEELAAIEAEKAVEAERVKAAAEAEAAKAAEEQEKVSSLMSALEMLTQKQSQFLELNTKKAPKPLSWSEKLELALKEQTAPEGK